MVVDDWPQIEEQAGHTCSPVHYKRGRTNEKGVSQSSLQSVGAYGKRGTVNMLVTTDIKD